MEGNFTSVVDVGVGNMTAHRRDKAGGGGRGGGERLGGKLARNCGKESRALSWFCYIKRL